MRFLCINEDYKKGRIKINKEKIKENLKGIKKQIINDVSKEHSKNYVWGLKRNHGERVYSGV